MSALETLTEFADPYAVVTITADAARTTTLTLEANGTGTRAVAVHFLDGAEQVYLFHDWMWASAIEKLRSDIEAFNADPAAGWAQLAAAAHESLTKSVDDARQQVGILTSLADQAAELRDTLTTAPEPATTR